MDNAMREILRYIVVGITVNLSGYLGYLLLTYWGAEPKLAITLMFASFLPLSFYWHNRFTFSRHNNAFKAKIHFVVLNVSVYLLNLALIYLLVDLLGFGHQWIQLLITFFMAVLVYVILKFFIFKKVSFADEKPISPISK
ncbi:GtrA family protein [Pseudomonadales bacterium]|nr:GtrA family protein [Pseudomonadales bacterium]